MKERKMNVIECTCTFTDSDVIIKDFGKRKILGLMEKLSVLILELNESNEIVNII